MKRTLFTLAAVAAGLLLGATPAAAAPDGACLTTYVGALAADVTANGPVHTSGGAITVGNFTPSVFLDGATDATNAYLRCTV